VVLEHFGRAVLSSKAVICRSLSIVQYLVSSDSALYNTFHQQVDAEARIPEDNRWDRARSLSEIDFDCGFGKRGDFS
jgi:hypothetical protein